jgi:hypothetical protein
MVLPFGDGAAEMPGSAGFAWLDYVLTDAWWGCSCLRCREKPHTRYLLLTYECGGYQITRWVSKS